MARFSASIQTGPGAHPAYHTMGTGSFPGVKRPRRGVDHPITSSAEVKERVELFLCSSSGFSWPVIGRTLPLQAFSNYQLNAQFLYSSTICMLHYDPQHVSSSTLPILRRTNCITTASGIITLCKQPYSMQVESICV